MSTDAPIQSGAAEAEGKSAPASEPTPPSHVDTLVTTTRDVLLDQHLNPAVDSEGGKITRFDQGRREGLIEAHLETLTTLHPAYTGHAPASLRIVLLGEALTAHARG